MPPTTRISDNCAIIHANASKMDLKLQKNLRQAGSFQTSTVRANMANLHINSSSPYPFVEIVRSMNRNQSRDRDNRVNPTLNAAVTLPQELSVRLDTTKFIIVDCRSFMAFNKKHIIGALNVNCTNPCFRRRLEKGKTSVGDLITSEEGKALFTGRSGKEVIVYDEDSQEIDTLPSNHPTVLVLKSLNKEGTRASLLKGGIKDFEFYYDGLCDSALKESRDIEEQPPSPTPDTCQYSIPNEPATELLPHLYVGNQLDAANLDLLESLGISYVLNATKTLPCYHDKSNIRYKRIAVKDNGVENLYCHFDEAFEFIEEARLKNEKVLLHCHAGISRSSTIAIAYIMKMCNKTMMQAYNFVKAKRPIVGPNMNFLGQLTRYEKTLRSPKISSCARQAQRSRTSSPATCSFSVPVVHPEI